METPIGNAGDASLARKLSLALLALALVGLDLFLSSRGVYMTPIRLVFLMISLGAYGWFAQWDSAALGLTPRPQQGYAYWIKAALIIGGLMLLLISISLPILSLFGKHISISGRSPGESARWFYFACINAPILEETVYRFILCVPLAPLLGPWGTIAISTVAFASLHVVTGVASPDNIVGGVFLSWAFLKSGSLAVPVTLHALGNSCILATQLAIWFWKG